MTPRLDMEYDEWLRKNEFSPEDEALILQRTRRLMIIWLILSHLPAVGLFTLPFLNHAWNLHNAVAQKTLSPRPGFWFSWYTLLLYLSFLTVIPLIVFLMTKEKYIGSGLHSLIKKGRVGNADISCAGEIPDYASAFTHLTVNRGAGKIMSQICQATLADQEAVDESRLALSADHPDEEQLAYVLAAGYLGNHTAIFNLVEYYHGLAGQLHREGDFSCIEFIKQSAIWFKVGIELDVKPLSTNPQAFQHTLNLIERWESVAGGDI